MPIDKCMAKAAGGTNQRLKPGLAIVRSLAKRPRVVVVLGIISAEGKWFEVLIYWICKRLHNLPMLSH